MCTPMPTTWTKSTATSTDTSKMSNIPNILAYLRTGYELVRFAYRVRWRHTRW